MVEVVVDAKVEFVFAKRLAQVPGVTGLAAAFAFALLAAALLRRRLDDVAGGGFGGVAGVLAGLGQLGFERRHTLLQLTQLALEFFALGTVCRRRLFHGGDNLTNPP